MDNYSAQAHHSPGGEADDEDIGPVAEGRGGSEALLEGRGRPVRLRLTAGTKTGNRGCLKSQLFDRTKKKYVLNVRHLNL